MRSRIASGLLLLGLIAGTTSCGLLGRKEAPKQDSAVGNGCLNNSKDLVKNYIAGLTSQAEWKAAFDCVDQSVSFFTEFVHGSTPSGYTQSDMFTLVSRFLITNRNVNRDLMVGAFQLKTALFGGSSGEITKAQVDLLRASIKRLREITSDLIPYLQVRTKRNPTQAEILDLMNAFKRAGDQLADYVNTLPTSFLTDRAVQTLINQLTASLDLPLIVGLSDKIFLAKWVLLNTRRDAIESADWSEFFRNAMTIGGIVVAFNTMIDLDKPSTPLPPDAPSPVMKRLNEDYQYRETVWSIAARAKDFLDSTIAKHNGSIPFPMLDNIIDELPDAMLDTVPKNILKNFLRPFLRRFAMSDSKEGLDQKSVNTIYSLVDELVKSMGLLDRFYEKTGLDKFNAAPAALSTALNQYASTLTNPEDQARFASMKSTILSYPALFYRDTDQIRYADDNGYTRLQNLLVVAFEKVGGHLIKTYGSGPDYLTTDDMTAFFLDYTDMLFAVKYVDPTVANFGKKRLQDMDLFTEVSDGDGHANLKEISNWGLMIISSSTLGSKMHKEISPVCKDTTQPVPTDLMGWEWVNADCFRKQFHQRLGYWIDSFPHLKKYWSTLSADEQAKAMVWLEHGTRRNGYNNDPLGKVDIGSFATVLHYTESMFMRFDENRDDTMERGEVDNAFPVFQNLLATKAAAISGIPYLLKSAFTYIVRYREMPPQITGLGDVFNNPAVARFVWWSIIYTLPSTDYSTDRAGVFNIICQLAAPETASQTALTPTICAP